MSSVAIQGNASGAGVFTIASPNSASSYTATLPTATTTLVGTDATQTLTNKTIQGGAITSGTAVASTSGTSIDFTSIPSWVKRITVMFQGVSTNGTSLIQVQIGTSGGIQTTSYTSGAWGSNTTNSTSTTGLLISGQNGAGYFIDGISTLALHSSATGLWVFSSVTSGSVSGTSAVGGGAKTLSGTLDRVRITTVNGTDTFDAGSINILYEG